MVTVPQPDGNLRGARVAAALSAAIAAGDQLAAARAYRALGVSIFPVETDGSKRPAFAGWREYAERLATDAEVSTWWRSRGRYGVGAAGGTASGNLAVLDFEAWPAFTAWGRRLAPDERERLGRCPVIGCPRGGAHVYTRTEEPVKGCKLARTATGQTLIEVRGSQHYVVAPGSPAACHPLGRAWRVLRPGWLDGGPWEPLPLDMYYRLSIYAADLNEYARPAAREVVGDRSRPGDVGERPGDHFNARVSWGDILGPVGWRVFHTSGAVTYWTRPGKPTGGSASTGYCRGPSGNDLLYVFSTSAAPFEAEVSYSRFAAYTLLHHHGDYASATRALGLAGYGAPARKQVRR